MQNRWSKSNLKNTISIASWALPMISATVYAGYNIYANLSNEYISTQESNEYFYGKNPYHFERDFCHIPLPFALLTQIWKPIVYPAVSGTIGSAINKLTEISLNNFSYIKPLKAQLDFFTAVNFASDNPSVDHINWDICAHAQECWRAYSANQLHFSHLLKAYDYILKESKSWINLNTQHTNLKSDSTTNRNREFSAFHIEMIGHLNELYEKDEIDEKTLIEHYKLAEEFIPLDMQADSIWQHVNLQIMNYYL